MIGVALFLFCLGLADLVAGDLEGMPRSTRRAIAAVAAAALVSAAGACLLVPRGSTALGVWIVAWTTVGVASWQLLRLGDLSQKRAWLSLALVFVLLALTVAWAGEWRELGAPSLEEGLRRLPFRRLSGFGAPELLLMAGVGAFLAATANGIVRTLLAAAGTRTQSAEQRLLGGRVIGILERYLIFGLALAGEPTAAALVISAKGIVRFPELSRAAPAEQVDSITEYFLLGSLASWSIALAPVVLFAD